MNSIASIQKELDETKIVLHKTIESVSCPASPQLPYLPFQPCPGVLPLPPCSSAGKSKKTNASGRSYNAARSSTTWWPSRQTSAPRARCSTPPPRSRTRAASSCRLAHPRKGFNERGLANGEGKPRKAWGTRDVGNLVTRFQANAISFMGHGGGSHFCEYVGPWTASSSRDLTADSGPR